MPIRIYALAKELDLDSKVLVDVCAKIGIQGKGSALASLTDEEDAKVRAHFAGDDGSSAAPGAPPKPVPPPEVASRSGDAPVRPDILSSSNQGKLRTLPPKTRRDEAAEVEQAEVVEEKVDEPVAEPEVLAPVASSEPTAAEVEETTEPQPTAEATDVAESTSKASAPGAAPLTSMMSGGTEAPKSSKPVPQPPPLAPPRLTGDSNRKIKSLDRRGRGGDREDKTRRDDDSGPVIRAAPMPAAKAPPARPKKDEPKPQKPEIRLPQDAIKEAKKGSGALIEHVKRVEKRRSQEAARGDSTTFVDEDGPKKGKGKRGDSGRPMTSEDRRRNRVKRVSLDEDGGDSRPRRWQRGRKPKKSNTNTAAPRKENVALELPCSVRQFSEAVGEPVMRVLQVMMQQLGMGGVNINSQLDEDLAEMLIVELGAEVDIRKKADLEEDVLAEFNEEIDPEKAQPRPPVVAFLGHVDHGKTSLLDRIIGTQVVTGEAGGITQHIRAYSIDVDGKQISFVDTPGHEAFTEMRARGANVTDIVVLVVAADDGIMPQTEEAISHARAAGVPIVVAMNKIDLPGVDTNRVLQQLSANELLPSEWGGETEVVRTSAINGDGIDDLMETLMTIADLHEYKADPEGRCTGTCIEAEQHEGRGVVAKVLVQNGTLKVGDIVVCGESHGRVKAMYDTLNPRKKHKEAGPSMPVNITGLDTAPGAGEPFYVLEDITEAREIAEQRTDRHRAAELGTGPKPATLDTFMDRLSAGVGKSTLPLIVRADTRGSIEAILKEFSKFEHPEVEIKLLQTLVGGVSEADVRLAEVAGAIIIAFSVVPDEKARSLARDRGIEIRRYDIIYRVTEDVKSALEGMLKPDEEVRELGRARVQQAFHISRVGTIAGCRVIEGIIRRDSSVRIRVIRNNTVIGDYPIDSLKRVKDDAKEVREGLECGIKLQGFNDIKEDDLLEAYMIEEVARTL